jgi:hypothetical protein
MGDRYRTPSGWSVEVVERSGTPDNSDGQQLRVRYHRFYVADVRTVAELEQWFPLADLEPDGLTVTAPKRPAASRRARDRRDHHRGRGGLMAAVAHALVLTAIGSGSPASLIAAALPASSANKLPAACAG